MDLKVMVGLINNTAFLLSICLVYDVLFLSPKAQGGPWKKVLSGVLLGVICVAVMFSHFVWHSGVIFDTRSILLGVSGLFFGPVPTAIAMAISAAYRFYLGGDGVMMGISVILASGLVGILWNRRCKSLADISLSELYLFGLALHVVMITLMFLLPGHLAADTMMRIGPAVLLVYPVGTVLLGKMMSFRHRRVRSEESLRESEERFAFAMEVTRDGLWDWDLVSGKGYFSPGFYRMLGCRPEELAIARETWLDMIFPEDRQWVLQAFDDCVNGKSDSLDVE
ncbi:MAG: LytS/YhcK type 5TM receptor domain-containing protein [Geobacteraceae bacterium]|nr:LytS/YhcK type 5TM receptor domain-containing protein [Geobacteraceae bacterium]